MVNRRSFAVALIAALAVTIAPAARAQNERLMQLAGTLGDYVWVEAGPGAGPWQVSGTWSARVNGDSGKGRFVAAILGVRSDLWVLESGVNPQTTTRSPHTHHVALLDADVTDIPGGIRMTGTAMITTNGNAADFSGSPVTIEITGGNAMRFSNMKLTFQGAGIGHFGSQPYDGVVTTER